MPERTLGPYELLGELGRGGMGVVYRARHTPTGALRAVKVLTGPPDPEAVARFRREAESLARLGGEGVVPIHDVGTERGQLYFAMALFPAGSLRARLRREGKLPWRDAVTAAREIALVLDRCHGQGMIHRDVKPDNVLLDDAGKPWLSDFGCVRDLGASRLTETGTFLGTLSYMSSDQLDGRPADAHSDVHALAVLLHELIAGTLPADGRTAFELVARRQKPRPRLVEHGAPAELDRVLDRAIVASSAADLARDLGAVLEGRSTGSNAALKIVLALFALAAAAVVLTVLLARRPSDVGPVVSPPVARPIPRPEDTTLERGRAAVLAGDDSGALAALGALVSDIALLSSDRDANATYRVFAPALYRRGLATTKAEARLADLEAAACLDDPPAVLASRVAVFWRETAEKDARKDNELALTAKWLTRARILPIERRLIAYRRALELDRSMSSNGLWTLLEFIHMQALNSEEGEALAIEILHASLPRSPLLSFLETRKLQEGNAEVALAKACEGIERIEASEPRPEIESLRVEVVAVACQILAREPSAMSLERLDEIDAAALRSGETRLGVIANAWNKHGQFDRAHRCLDRQKPESDDLELHYRCRCEAFLGQGKKAEALEFARKLVALAPGPDTRKLLEACQAP